MVRITNASRMRSVTDARSNLNNLVDEATTGRPTYITKGATVAAVLAPPSWGSLPLRDQVMKTLLRSTAAEAARELRARIENGARFRDPGDRWILRHAGDSIGMVIAWVRDVDPDEGLALLARYCEYVIAQFEDAGWPRPTFGAIWAALQPAFPGGLDPEMAEFETDARERLHEFSEEFTPDDLLVPSVRAERLLPPAHPLTWYRRIPASWAHEHFGFPEGVADGTTYEHGAWRFAAAEGWWIQTFDEGREG